MNDIDRELATEAIRVMRQSPPWIPGLQRGVPVNVLSVIFPFPLILGGKLLNYGDF